MVKFRFGSIFLHHNRRMNNNLKFVLLNSFIVPLFLGILSFMISKRLKSKEFAHLTEFWVSLTVMMALTFALNQQSEQLMTLSLLGWIWPIKGILEISRDMSGQKLHVKPKVLVLGIGAFLTLAMVSYDFSFRVYTAPFCLSIGVVGLMIFQDLYLNPKAPKYSLLGHVTFSMLGLFLAVRCLYPLWRPDYVFFGYSVHLLILVGLGVSTTAYYMEVMKERHERQLEAVLKERSDQLFGQSKYSELGMMSAGIAHEINNPLAIIQAKTTQLLRSLANPDRAMDMKEGLEQILLTSERINRTIKGVRDFVHQDDRLPDEEFTVKSLVDDVLAFCGQRMKNHGINLRFYGMDNFLLRGHKIQLEQVLLNLLNNSFDAIEFLPDKWIELSVHEMDDTIQMYFKDSGSGIPQEVALKIMEPFFTTKKVGKGTGLGLALARGIIEKHGGSLNYVEKARHTTFMIELPKVKHLEAVIHRKNYQTPPATSIQALH